MEKYQNEGLNIVAEKYPNIDFSDVDGKNITPVGAICVKLGINIIRTIFEVGYHGHYEATAKTIFVNKTDYATSERFTVAYELGYYLLHEGINNRCDRYAPAKMANDFAVKLLMPKEKFIQSFHRKNGIIFDVAYEFGVSVQACQVRAFNLGLVTNL